MRPELESPGPKACSPMETPPCGEIGPAAGRRPVRPGRPALRNELGAPGPTADSAGEPALLPELCRAGADGRFGRGACLAA